MYNSTVGNCNDYKYDLFSESILLHQDESGQSFGIHKSKAVLKARELNGLELLCICTQIEVVRQPKRIYLGQDLPSHNIFAKNARDVQVGGYSSVKFTSVDSWVVLFN